MLKNKPMLAWEKEIEREENILENSSRIASTWVRHKLPKTISSNCFLFGVELKLKFQFFSLFSVVKIDDMVNRQANEHKSKNASSQTACFMDNVFVLFFFRALFAAIEYRTVWPWSRESRRCFPFSFFSIFFSDAAIKRFLLLFVLPQKMTCCARVFKQQVNALKSNAKKRRMPSLWMPNGSTKKMFIHAHSLICSSRVVSRLFSFALFSCLAQYFHCFNFHVGHMKTLTGRFIVAVYCLARKKNRNKIAK